MPVPAPRNNRRNREEIEIRNPKSSLHSQVTVTPSCSSYGRRVNQIPCIAAIYSFECPHTVSSGRNAAQATLHQPAHTTARCSPLGLLPNSHINDAVPSVFSRAFVERSFNYPKINHSHCSIEFHPPQWFHQRLSGRVSLLSINRATSSNRVKHSIPSSKTRKQHTKSEKRK
jgi:hypothetical protein